MNHSQNDAVVSAASPTGDPYLFTPGPLTTSPTVKQAMQHDFGSRDARFIRINAGIREDLLAIANAAGTHECVPLQGSGTFIVEAMLVNFIPVDGKVLILVNGAYGKRIATICQRYGRDSVVEEWPEDTPVDPKRVAELLEQDASISQVVVVYCETTTGLLNPLAEVADVVQQAGRGLLIDAMSAFGALPLDATEVPFHAVVASSNKCLEGVPGMGFCLVRRDVLQASRGNCPSLCLDLHDQWQALESNGQWRFTPPTHCILALSQAIDEFKGEGGVAGRGARYRENCDVLTAGMRALGFEVLLPDHLQAPIIVTFKMPADEKFDFESFYAKLSARGFVIYPGKLTVAPSFRMGCIGRMGADEMRAAVAAVEQVMAELGVASGAPA